MEQVDTVVVGAGVVGLACARALALGGREVIVLESEGAIGQGVSSRNSEVIHSGIYYPKDSLKAVHCVRGARLLYSYLAERKLPYARCGKLIVATAADEMPRLEGLLANGMANGAPDLRMLAAADVHAMEPEVFCVSALSSPNSGIVDSHALMLSFLGDAENAGAVLVLNTQLARSEVADDGVRLTTSAGDDIHARSLVNAAGLGAQALAAAMKGFPAENVPPLYLAKGNYFALRGRSPMKSLIYPLAEAAGLGVHLTIDLNGQAKFGPDVQWIDAIDYEVDPARGEVFYAAVRKFWPALPDGALQPAYAGIRPKLQAPGEGFADFRIDGPAQHGVPRVIQLFGIESPGLTSSLSIAEQVAAMHAQYCR